MPPANALDLAIEAAPKSGDAPLVIDLPKDSIEAAAVSTMRRCNEATRANETLYRAAREPLRAHVEAWWLAKLLAGEKLDGPVKFRNPANGDTVSWVVQDRTESTDLDPADAKELTALVGRRPRDTVREETVYKFDPALLEEPLADGSGRVYDLVGEAIAAALKKGVRRKQLTQAQADALLVKVTRRRLVPGVLPKLPKLAGDLETLRRCFELLGSAVVRFLRT